MVDGGGNFGGEIENLFGHYTTVQAPSGRWKLKVAFYLLISLVVVTICLVTSFEYTSSQKGFFLIARDMFKF